MFAADEDMLRSKMLVSIGKENVDNEDLEQPIEKEKEKGEMLYVELVEQVTFDITFEMHKTIRIMISASVKHVDAKLFINDTVLPTLNKFVKNNKNT